MSTGARKEALLSDEDIQHADDGYDPFKISSMHENFTEKDEVISLIHSLENVNTNLIETERAVERFTYIVDSYQEQPHLMDPYLDEFVNLIISRARQPRCEEGHRYLLFTFLHLLVKMRGYKVVLRWLPHEVADVEPVLDLLAQQQSDSVERWQEKYCLLLWLSMVAMIPFDLSRLDNVSCGEDDQKAPVMDRILNQAKMYIGAFDKSSDAAAYVLAKFLTRPDVQAKKMSQTIDWALNMLKTCSEDSVSNNAKSRGVLMMLAQLFKLGKREDLIPYSKQILDVITHDTEIQESSNIVIRKLGVKLIQRIGLIFLKAKVASWRYSRGNRSLAANLAAAGVKVSSDSLSNQYSSAAKTSGEDDEDEDYDIPDEMEEIIEHLLTSLKDKDTIVRWSAAKGVGRVSGRLPKELADEVIASLLDLFTFHETDAAWHGGCLALAELGRRGLLLPQRLPEVIPVLLKSLVYDEKKGNFSIGSHVRDSACYVCWSFARAYEPSDIKPYAQQIASALIIVAVFDREVNVRRAASAAFQENVGRQGTFPHGIDILTTCDYFAVGNRTHSYLELSKFVASFPEYTEALIEHLIEYKVNHWAEEIRELTSKALYNLATLAPTYVLTSVLPKLIPMALGPDLNCRHGAIMAVGQICRSLSESQKVISQEILDCVLQIEPTLRSRKLLLGLGGEYMRRGLFSMIDNLSQIRCPKTNHKVIDNQNSVIAAWQNLLNEGLFYVDNTVQQAAIDAISHFFSLYERTDGLVEPSTQDEIITSYLKLMSNPPNLRTCIGAVIALGSLTKPFLKGQFNRTLSALIECSKAIVDQGKEWAEVRTHTFKAIEKICLTAGIQTDRQTDSGSVDDCVCKDNIRRIYEAYLLGLDDYTIDSRGDIGSWSREACMSGIKSLAMMAVAKQPELLERDIVEECFKKISQQACEKIDRVRHHAGTTLTSLLYLPAIPNVPERQALESVFPRNEIQTINFAAPSDTFGRFSKLLDLDVFRYHVLLGFSVSVGGLTESLVKHSYIALIDHIRTEDGVLLDKLKLVCTEIIRIFKNHAKDDRVTIPLMKMTEQLLSSGIFNDLVSNEEFTFPIDLLECIKTETSRTNDPQKLMTAIDGLCGLLIFEGVRQKCLFQLAIFLCHRFPIVRKTTAKKLFESIISGDDIIDDEKLDDCISLLSDTDWDDPIEKVKPLRNDLCDLLGISKPVVKKLKPAEETKKQ